MNPDDFTELADRIRELYGNLELEILLEIARRLRADESIGQNEIYDWRQTKLSQINAFNSEIVRILSQSTGVAMEMIEDIFIEVGEGSYKGLDDELPNTPNLPIENIPQVVSAYIDQTFLEIDNLVNQTLITTNLGTGTASLVYQRVIEETTAKAITGQITVNQAIAESVINWRKKGIPSGFIDKGGNRWNIQNYASTVVRSTVNRTYNELRTNRMEQYGIDLVLVSTHGDPRPICARCQGRVLTISRYKKGYKSIYDYEFGQPQGLRGINCRHVLTPFVKGVNKNNEKPPKVLVADKNYELSQKQRYYERQVRNAKDYLRLAEEISDEKEIERYKKMVRNRQSILRGFVKENDLIRRYDKERLI